MTDAGDETLVERAQQGDRDAFAALVDRYWSRVHHWLARLGRSEQLAEDLTQDAFLKVWKGLPNYEPRETFRAWLFQIARNGWIDHCRRKPGLPEGGRLAALPGREMDPSRTAAENEFAKRLAAAVENLPDELRDVWILRMQQSMSSAEAAQVLDTKEETVRWRIFKARQILFKQMSAFFDRPELPS